MTDSRRTAFTSTLAFGLLFWWNRDARATEWPTDSPNQRTQNLQEPGGAPRTERDSGPAGDGADRARKPEHFRLGVLGGVGFPRPLAIEGMLKIERALGLGVEYSVMPTFTISGVETRFWALAGDVRVFPGQGAFFLGLRGGHQHLGAQGAITVQRYGTLSESLTVDTTFVNPRLGCLWTFEPGFSIGIDAGVQIPLSTSSSNTLPAGTAASTEVNRVASSYGQKLLPTIDLLRIGFLI